MGWGAVAHESGGVVHGYRYAVPGYVYTGVYVHGCICRMASESLFSVFSVEMKMKIPWYTPEKTVFRTSLYTRTVQVPFPSCYYPATFGTA